MKETIITLENIRDIQKSTGHSVVKRARVIGSNNKPTYVLLEELNIKLSNGDLLTIEEGFTWDLSSVPRPLWGILPPDGDFELASLIHDALYIHKPFGVTRKFADDEMYLWSKAVSGTHNKTSVRNFDNWLRYKGVRLFGNIVWSRKR